MELDLSTVDNFRQQPPALRSSVEAIIPVDSLRSKRLRNLSKAYYVLVARSGDQVSGVLFVRKILGIPNTTWIVSEAFRRKGIALRLLSRAQGDHSFLTAVCRNEPSAQLAKKAGFRLLPLGIATWRGSP